MSFIKGLHSHHHVHFWGLHTRMFPTSALAGQWCSDLWWLFCNISQITSFLDSFQTTLLSSLLVEHPMERVLEMVVRFLFWTHLCPAFPAFISSASNTDFSLQHCHHTCDHRQGRSAGLAGVDLARDTHHSFWAAYPSVQNFLSPLWGYTCILREETEICLAKWSIYL